MLGIHKVAVPACSNSKHALISNPHISGYAHTSCTDVPGSGLAAVSYLRPRPSALSAWVQGTWKSRRLGTHCRLGLSMASLHQMHQVGMQSSAGLS